VAEQIRSNLRMIGTNATSGGFFRNVSVTGECQFTGDVDCQKLSLTGKMGLAGNLQADKFKITGECTVDGHIKGFSLKGQGEFRTFSNLRIDQIRFSGSLDVKGNCEAENLHISGAAQVEGLLSADQLEIGLYGPSRAKEVGGGSIMIKRSSAARIIGLLKPRQDAFFEAELIEGDIVDLQHTKADTVRGKRVIIGADCEVNTVEFRETLEIHKNAIVKHQMRI